MIQQHVYFILHKGKWKGEESMRWGGGVSKKVYNKKKIEIDGGRGRVE